MQGPRRLAGATAVAASLFGLSSAQAPGTLTDAETGIKFATWGQERAGQGVFTFGLALPSDALEKDATEYIGYLRCSSSSTDHKGWCGLSHGESGQMTAALLLMAWPFEGQVLTSFRFADGYYAPYPYTGNAKLTQIRSKVDDTGYELLYRCENCFHWDQDGTEGSVATSSGNLILGRAQSLQVPTKDIGCPSKITIPFHNDGFGQFGARIQAAVAPDYAKWTGLATKTVAGNCGNAVPVPAPDAAPAPAEPKEPEKPTAPKVLTSVTILRPRPTVTLPAPGKPSSASRAAPARPSSSVAKPRPSAPARSSRAPVSKVTRSARPTVPAPVETGRVTRPGRPESPGRTSRVPTRPSGRPVEPEAPEAPKRPVWGGDDEEDEEEWGGWGWPGDDEEEEEEESPPARPMRGGPRPAASSASAAPKPPSSVSAAPRPPSAPARPVVPATPAVEPPSRPAPLPPVREGRGVERRQETTSAAAASSPAAASPTEATTEPEATAPAKIEGCTTLGAGGQTYDYIVVGGGAGGIPVADKLSEAGHTVLLIEKGPPSTARWGGKLKPEWLEGVKPELTRFDVPGLCNQIWIDPTGVSCQDTDQMAGCVLGGGVAVNAGLWWKPYPDDWDANFPAGWKSTDVAAATERVFKRIPGTSTPSMDGKRYEQEGFEALAVGFNKAGWQGFEDANVDPTSKNHTYARTTFMFSGGERGGPLATYLVTASERKGFTLWTDTNVNRVVRQGGHVSGVEVQCTASGGKTGTINVTPGTGRVILSAGTFGSAKLLMRSGIGPADQLQIVRSSAEGETMVANNSWINLPVGYNLIDHTNTDTVVEHPNVVQYNYTKAWLDPVQKDADMYIANRTGVLAQAAPNIGPMMWDQILGADGTVRQLQWTSRMEGSLDLFGPTTITMSQYLGRGVKSRGRMAITRALTTRVSVVPFLRDQEDVAAVVKGLDNMRAALSDVPGLTWLSPAPNVTSEDYVANMLVTTARRANHWIGTNKMGTDSGLEGGTAVVDPDTKVYGTDNLFVVDASIFPGMMTGNPSAMIVIAAERAAERILALKATAAPATPATPPAGRM